MAAGRSRYSTKRRLRRCGEAQRESIDIRWEGSHNPRDERTSAARLSGGPLQGHVGYVSLSGAEEYLHRAVSPGTADGGGALSRGAAAEHEPGDWGVAVHFVQFVRAGLPGKFDCGGLAARRCYAAQGSHHIYVRYFALHVLRIVRRRLPHGLFGIDAGFRNGQLQPRRRDLGSPSAGSWAHTYALHPLATLQTPVTSWARRVSVTSRLAISFR